MVPWCSDESHSTTVQYYILWNSSTVSVVGGTCPIATKAHYNERAPTTMKLKPEVGSNLIRSGVITNQAAASRRLQLKWLQELRSEPLVILGWQTCNLLGYRRSTVSALKNKLCPRVFHGWFSCLQFLTTPFLPKPLMINPFFLNYSPLG